ncbi:hypothetical protein ACFVT2_04050 [Streptomyces sp. NPDC058000]|uniref:hypothetical protein n=1 Tax=Streptomyces sp. NPDC058000 TaxID=3346299 RepID=UPI0036F03C7B
MANIGYGGPPRARPTGGLDWLWIALGMVQLLAAAPMLALMVGGGVVTGIMGLAGGGTPGEALLLAVLLGSGPVVGLAVPLSTPTVPSPSEVPPTTCGFREDFRQRRPGETGAPAGLSRNFHR